MLLQDKRHHFESLMVVIMNWKIIMVHLFASWEQFFLQCHSFFFLFCLPWMWHFMSKSAGVARKAEKSYPTGAPGLCTQLIMPDCSFTFVSLQTLFWLFLVFNCMCLFYLGIYSSDYCLNPGSLDYSLNDHNNPQSQFVQINPENPYFLRDNNNKYYRIEYLYWRTKGCREHKI